MALDESPYIFQLVIADACSASWMCTTNTFTRVHNWSEKKSLWNGILIQLGDFSVTPQVDPAAVPPPAPEPAKWPKVFSQVSFLKEGNPLPLVFSRDDFSDKLVWINIVARRSDAQYGPPMTWGHLESLGVAPKDTQKAIHEHMKACPGGITLWYDREDGFLMSTEQAAGTNHSKFTFSLFKTDEFTVTAQVFNNGVPSGTPDEEHVFTGAGIDKLIVEAGGGIDHAGHDNPPQR